jgi:hypothetical protein
MPHKFLVQPKTPPDSKLCAFFALYHFTDGGVAKQDFITQATNHYVQILGMAQPEAQALVLDGNDPSVLGLYHLSQSNEANLKKKGLGIIANTNNGHFFTVRFEGGKWYSYDSYNYTAPKEYATFDALKQAEIPSGSQIWL